MRLLVLGVALAIGVGALALLGLLVMVRELFCQNIPEASSMTDDGALRDHPKDVSRQADQLRAPQP
jgi:hypothetical protein